MRQSTGWTCGGLVLALGGWCAAADEAPLHLSRLGGRVVVDGRPDDDAWKAIAPLPLTTYAPVYHGAAVQRSEIRVAYDDEALYAAGWFYDEEPAGIRVNSLYRDRWNGDDAFAIYVDAFNDNTNAKWFGVTPAAMRFDQLVSDDGAHLNESWDGYWDAETSLTEEGWFAEVRIPFATLGFQSADGRAVMGLTVTRLVSRSGERVTFPDIDPRFEFRAPSQAQDVVLDDVRSHTPLYLTPYAARPAPLPARPPLGHREPRARGRAAARRRRRRHCGPALRRAAARRPRPLGGAREGTCDRIGRAR